MSENFSILIVEDDDDARSNMEDVLSLDGYQIDSASRCSAAVDAVQSRHFDAVIVDWRLPDGSGGDLISVIKRHLPESPVIVVTGLRDFDTAVSALREGAWDFLTKPINPDALRGLLGRLVERKSHLAEIESAQAKLVATERLAAIGQMVAGLAHESRNVFQRSHACLAELTLDLQSMPESLRLVHRVQKALDDLHLLLEEVRSYSAPIILERRECNLESLVNETWQQIRDTGLAKAIPELKISASADFPKSVFIDGHRFAQVIRNILENAMFACGEPGKVDVDLGLQKTAVRTSVAVSFSDDGDGVPEERHEEIFAPFFTTKTRGTGLGLAISRRIVEAHDGTISVTKSLAGGARFDLVIPLKEASQ